MAKKYIKKFTNGASSKDTSPAAGAKIKRDIGPVIPAVSSKDYVSGVMRNQQKEALTPADPGIGKDSRATGNSYSAPQKTKTFSGASFGQALSSDTAQGIYSGLGLATDIGTQFIDQDPTKNPTGFQSQQAIGDALIKSGNPYAAIAGVAYKALSGIAEATGGNVNTITKDQAREVGLTKSERFFNNVLGVIPGMGWASGSETAEGQKSHLINEMSNAYADSVYDIDQAQTLGGSKFLFGKNKIQNSILEANRRNQQLTDINTTNTMRKKSDYAQDLAQQNLNRYMGTNYMDMRMGRNGLKFPELDEIREMISNRVVSTDVQKFADGGSILPTGKLHKELSHINELGEQYEDLTRKGIPVVTLDEGGELQQVAEIEKYEICLSKEITDQLEALWKDGSEEAMIDAGKLIANEILYNMQDADNILGKEEEEKDE